MKGEVLQPRREGATIQSDLDRTTKEVETGGKILADLKAILQRAGASATIITAPWLRQLQSITSDSPKLIIGIVGATGSGKSSVINALLGEKQLIPTNCMRACTAVVTEISWNDQEGLPYRAAIEFVSQAEWRKELDLLLSDVEGAAGSIHDEDSESGIAYSKIKAVYPHIMPQDLAKVSVEQLMQEERVAEVLGHNIELERESALALYNVMKGYIDSKEKTPNSQVGANAEIEFWPMIRRVSISTKAPVLATGCVLVDLPGVADSNAARAVVARKYIQNCAALWVVAPIIRAVDDKSARYLLGEGFKRQLQRDGTLSRMTFVCSKTDEIVLSEVRGVLKHDADFVKDIEPIDKAKAEIERDRTALLQAITSLEADIVSLGDQAKEAMSKEKAYKDLKTLGAEGSIVYPPVLVSTTASSPNKRQRPRDDGPFQSPKKSRTQQYLPQTYLSPSRRQASTPMPVSTPTTSPLLHTTNKGYNQDTTKPPLTPTDVAKQLQELKDLRIKIKIDKKDLMAKKKEHKEGLVELKEIAGEVREREWAACVLARNKYSSSYIHEDFAAGIQDLNRDEAEDDMEFDPNSEVQHDEVSNQTLPVFCVSSQGFQKLRGNMEDEKVSACFNSEEETGIPALRNHAYNIGAAEMIVAGEAHTKKVKSLLTSLELWSSGDDTALITDEEAHRQNKRHEEMVEDLVKGLLHIFKRTLRNIEFEVTTKILDVLPSAATSGTSEAVLTAEKWAAPRKSEAPGLAWATYKATVRREGRFANTKKEHNFNEDLAKPFMRELDPKWNNVFNRAIYQMLDDGMEQCRTKVDVFGTAFDGVMAAKGTTSTVRAMFHKQLKRFDGYLAEILRGVGKTIKTEQKAANRVCEEIIQREMVGVYQECEVERGIGSFMRMKTNMKTHLEDNSRNMFEEVHTTMKYGLQKMLKSIKRDALGGFGKSSESFKRDCGYLISRKGREFSDLKQGVQAEILKFLEMAKELFDAATRIVVVKDEQSEQSLPVRSASAAAAPAITDAEPSRIYTATDWGEVEEEDEADDESDSHSELSDIQP